MVQPGPSPRRVNDVDPGCGSFGLGGKGIARKGGGYGLGLFTKPGTVCPWCSGGEAVPQGGLD